MKHALRLSNGEEAILLALTESELDEIISALEGSIESFSDELSSAEDDPDYEEAIVDSIEKTQALLTKLNNISYDYRFRCVDCSVNTGYIEEYYTVHDKVWKKTGLGSDDGMLCIGCLEKGIGRKLTPKDFNRKAMINHKEYAASDRKKDRLGHSD